MANNTTLRDGNVFLDFTLWIQGVGKIGECPGFQPPDIKIQTEDFRGGGMDGTVELPTGIEKIEFDFDVHVWDPDIFNNLGFGAGALDTPINLRGHLRTPAGKDKAVLIETLSLIKGIKPTKIEPGKKAELNVSCSSHYYCHTLDGKVVNEISVFDKITNIGGTDKSQAARKILGFTY